MCYLNVIALSQETIFDKEIEYCRLKLTSQVVYLYFELPTIKQNKLCPLEHLDKNEIVIFHIE